MAFNGQAYRAYSAPAPGRVVKGLSALDMVIEAGYLPLNAGPVEFAAWLRAPVDEIVGDLALLVNPLVDAAMVPYMADINQAVSDAQGFATAAGTSAGNAVDAAADALDYRNQAQQIVDDFEATAPTPASVAEVLAGTDAAKYIAPLSLRNSQLPNPVAYSATPAPDFTNSAYWRMSLTGNLTSVGAPVGCKEGITYTMEFLNSGGARTYPSSGNWNAAFLWGSAGFPTFQTASGGRNIVTALCVQDTPSPLLVVTHWK